MTLKIKRTHSPAFKRCVKQVKGVRSPYAVCTKSLGKKAFVKNPKKKKKK